MRPDFNEKLITIIPKIAPNLIKDIDNLKPNVKKESTPDIKYVYILCCIKIIFVILFIYCREISVGTICKNGGCNQSYEGPQTDDSDCIYHPGVPIFHEGLKFWSCCTKRTTDFTAFMNQIGCNTGKHKWISTEDNSDKVNCRFDWHQTAANVVLAIYAKLYHYDKSTVKMNPIRLKVTLIFPQQNNSEFNLDLELRGVSFIF